MAQRNLFRKILWALLFLAGCDQQGRAVQEFGLDKLAPGISSEGDVRTVMGRPETVWEDDNGVRTLEYPKAPEGLRTWVFHIDANGKLIDYRQALTEENFARVTPGMSQGEVRYLLGKPRSIVRFKLKNEEVWDWRYLQPNNQIALFNVHFDIDSGKVTRTSQSMDASQSPG